MWSQSLNGYPYPLVQWGAVLGASLVAAWIDTRSRRIPNVLTGPLFCAGLLAASFYGGGNAVLDALAAGFLLALPFVLLFVFAGGGAGDAKLMAGIGAWLGIGHGLTVLGAVSFTGVAFAIVYAAHKRRLRTVRLRLTVFAKGALMPLAGTGSLRDLPAFLPAPEDSQKMPYGLAIFVGTAIAAGLRFPWPV